MRVSIMQPAFLPPAGYFRLFAAVDIFVIYDDVQFNRRWYTHRQKLTLHDGSKDWFTLPIKKTDRDTTMIRDLEWATDAKERMEEEEKRFAMFDTMTPVAPHWFYLKPIAFIMATMDEAMQRLGMKFPEMRMASAIETPANLYGQDRILSICKSLGATEYINSPGGRDLYNEEDFFAAGIKLTFLSEMNNNDSIFERLVNEDPETIRKEIYDNI